MLIQSISVQFISSYKCEENTHSAYFSSASQLSPRGHHVITIFIFFGEKVLVLRAQRVSRGVSHRGSLCEAAPSLNSTEDGSLDVETPKIYSLSICFAIILRTTVKSCPGTKLQHTNLPLKSKPWGCPWTLLINSESHQRVPAALWRYEPALPGSHLSPRRMRPQTHIPLHRQMKAGPKGPAPKGWAGTLAGPIFLLLFFFRRQFLHGSLMD